VTPVRALEAVDPGEARRHAEDILSDRRFRDDPAPRPLRGPLEWIGDRLEPVGSWLADVLDAVPLWLWIALAVAVAAAVLARLAVVARRRRAGRGPAPARAARDDHAPEDPAGLERRADAAERAGDLGTAVRLRFRAGLLRLGEHGAIAYRPSLTTGEVRDALGSAAFDELAGRFEAIAYGGREAGPPDVEHARRSWPAVIREAARR
jgi:hypothetical protein